MNNKKFKKRMVLQYRYFKFVAYVLKLDDNQLLKIVDVLAVKFASRYK